MSIRTRGWFVELCAHRSWTAMVATAAILAGAGTLQAQDGGPLFPQPFRVEHHLVQEDGEGTRFVGEPVTDVYGGSWIVSQRPDGSRLIVDLARRELTEVRAEKGTYWTVTFDRLGELRDRLRAAQGLTTTTDDSRAEKSAAAKSAARKDATPLVVTEVAVGADARSGAVPSGLAKSAGLRHLRVSRGASPGEATAADVWVDPATRLGPSAMAALARFESQVLTPGDAAADSTTDAPAQFVAAARAHADGAFPVHTRRPLMVTHEGAAIGAVEDIVTRIDRLDRFPADLVEVPAGLRRVPHPLEGTVHFLEEERERNRSLTGGSSR